MLPAQLTSSPIMRVVVTGAVAFGAGFLAGKVSKPLGDAVLFGGLMQTGSVALNAFLPGIPIGLGAFAPAAFGTPDNPIRRGIAAPVESPANASSGMRVGVSGLHRAFGTAL
jgi:hypothetical protein